VAFFGGCAFQEGWIFHGGCAFHGGCRLRIIVAVLGTVLMSFEFVPGCAACGREYLVNAHINV